MTPAGALTDADRRALLGVAADAIREALSHRGAREPDPDDFAGRVAEPGASFVTLERGEQLLGCIGSLTAVEPLVVDVARHALAAAFADPRLPPVTRDDFEDMSIKVSVLTPHDPIVATSFDELATVVRSAVDGLVFQADERLR